MKITVRNLTIEAKSLLAQSNIEIIDVDISKIDLIDFVEDNYIEGIIFDNIEEFNSDVIDSCPSVKLIAFKEEIEENADIQYAKDQGIHVISISNAVATAKAELAFAHLMGMARFLHQSNREMPLEGDSRFEYLKQSLTGIELKGKKIGVIGINETGKELARIAIGLGMKPLITDHEPKNLSIPIEYFDGQSIEFNLEYSNFNDVISQSDFIILNTKTNTYIIDDNNIEQLKKGVGIVTISQGGINEVALINAINEEKIMFAGIDAFENQPTPEIQLLMNPELSLSPNIGQQTYEAQLRISTELANSIIEVFG